MKQNQMIKLCLMMLIPLGIMLGAAKTADHTAAAKFVSMYHFVGTAGTEGNPANWVAITAPPACTHGINDYCLLNVGSYTLADAVSLAVTYVNNTGGLTNKPPTFDVLDSWGSVTGIRVGKGH